MKSFRIIFTAFALFAHIWANSQGVYESSKGSVSILSDAPLEAIKASSSKLRGIVNFNENKFAFSLEVKSIVGFNSDLQQEHFHENYLESNKFPTASFSGKLIDRVDPNQSNQIIRAKGILDIHGIKKERIIPIEVTKTSKGYKVSANFNVSLEDHGIEIPRIVHQKIAEIIEVNISADLAPKP